MIRVTDCTCIFFATLANVSGLLLTAHAAEVTPAEARTIAKEACIYGFPLVDNYRNQHFYFPDKESNWLPAPQGWFMVVVRLYWPKEEAPSGKWTSPTLRHVK